MQFVKGETHVSDINLHLLQVLLLGGTLGADQALVSITLLRKASKGSGGERQRGGDVRVVS